MEIFNRSSEAPPKNYLVESILITIFCCLPFGIAGIVNAVKVESLFGSGDLEGAKLAAANAKKWVRVGLILGTVLFAFLLFFYAWAFYAIGEINTSEWSY